MIHTVKGFGIVNKAKVDVFSGTLLLFWWSRGCWQFDLWSSAFSKSSSNIWKFMVRVLLKPGLENFEHYFASLWDVCNCVVVWAFFALPFFGTGMKTDLFQPHPSTENWIRVLLSIDPPIRTRPSFLLSQYFPSGSFHKPLIILHQGAGRLKNHSHRSPLSVHKYSISDYNRLNYGKT